MRTSQQRPSHSEFVKRALIVTGLVLAVILFILLAWQLLDIFVILFAGVLFGVFLTSISGWIRQRTPLSHRQALAVTVLILLVLVIGGGWLAAPALVAQGEQLGSDLRESVDSLQSTLADQEWAQPILDRLPDSEQIISSFGNVAGQISMLFSRTFSIVTNVVVILFVGLYLAFEPDLYTNGLIRLVPHAYRRRAGEVLDELAYTLRWWLAGRLASMLIVGVLSVVGLVLLGIPLAFILGVLTGLLAFIPFFGPLIALFPPMLIAFTISPTQALYVFLLYMGIQLVESYLLTPVIQRKAAALPPVALIVSQITFGALFNLIGVIVAPPAAATLIVLTKMLYVKDILGDDEVELLKEEPEAHFEASKEAAQVSQRQQ